MKIEAIVRSYWRSVRRGARTIEDVPEALREAVRALEHPAEEGGTSE